MEGFDIGMLPPEIQAKLSMLADAMNERKPEGEVSYERLGMLNDEVFEVRTKLLKAQYKGAKFATDKLVKSIEDEIDTKNRKQTLTMAIVSLESTIEESKKELMQTIMKQKLDARKQFKRGENGLGEDMDMLDAIIAASEEEADYDPAESQRRVEETSKSKQSSNGGFGFGSNRA